MTDITRTFDPNDAKLVSINLPYRSRLALSMALKLDDQRDKRLLEEAWTAAVLAGPDELGAPPDPNRIPTLDEATRFIQSNPETTARILSGLKP